MAQKGTQLLEIYALEIQMHNEMKNFKKLKVGNTPARMTSSHAYLCRKSTTSRTQYALPSHTHASWASSRNAVARCGWVNVSAHTCM